MLQTETAFMFVALLVFVWFLVELTRIVCRAREPRLSISRKDCDLLICLAGITRALPLDDCDAIWTKIIFMGARLYLLVSVFARSEDRRRQYNIASRECTTITLVISLLLVSVAGVLSFLKRIHIQSCEQNELITEVAFNLAFMLSLLDANGLERKIHKDYRYSTQLIITQIASLIGATGFIIHLPASFIGSQLLMSLVIVIPILLSKHNPIREIEYICARGGMLWNAHEALISPFAETFMAYCESAVPGSTERYLQALTGKSVPLLNLSTEREKLEEYWPGFKRIGWSQPRNNRDVVSLSEEESDDD